MTSLCFISTFSLLKAAKRRDYLINLNRMLNIDTDDWQREEHHASFANVLSTYAGRHNSRPVDRIGSGCGPATVSCAAKRACAPATVCCAVGRGYAPAVAGADDKLGARRSTEH